MSEDYCRFLDVARNAKKAEEKLGIKFSKSLDNCLNCNEEKSKTCPTCVRDPYESNKASSVFV